MNKDEILESTKQNESPKRLDRRELLSKYGPYTAPVVISLLLPSQAYGHTADIAYSTVAACAAADVPSGMGNHGPMTQHCMFGGGGFMNAHDITNP